MANIIPKVFDQVEFKRVTVPGDLFCRQGVRSFVIASANKIFCLLLLGKIFLLHYRSTRRSVKGLKSLFIVRNWHQARFAKILFPGCEGASFIVLPQASQGSFSGLNACLRVLEEKAEGVYLTVGDLYESIKAYRRDLKKLVEFKRVTVALEPLKLGDVSFSYSFEGLWREVMLSTVVVLYKNVLSVALKKSEPAKIVNFELVGRMAGLEALAARQCGVTIHSIQTALISSTSHPIFPYADWFYADGLITQRLIENIGVKRKG